MFKLIQLSRLSLIASRRQNLTRLVSLARPLTSLHHQNSSILIHKQFKRQFHASFQLLEDQKNNNDDPPDDIKNVNQSNNNNNNNNNQVPLIMPSMTQLAPLQVPDFFPKVPLIAVARNPLFPRFIKMIEISDKNLIDLIRRKVHLNMPFLGVFMRKDEKDDDVVKSLDEVYSIGTFTQIHEIQDLGDKLRMVVMGHRRIKLNGISLDDLSTSSTTSSTAAAQSLTDEKTLKNGLRRRFKKQTNGIVNDESSPSIDDTLPQPPKSSSPSPIDNQILMVDTSNLVHHEFTTNQEMKAVTNEIIKTIRDIISMNPLYRESISLLLQSGQRVVDNPVYLSDLGAALTNSDSKEQQEVLEELNVNIFILLFTLLIYRIDDKKNDLFFYLFFKSKN